MELTVLAVSAVLTAMGCIAVPFDSPGNTSLAQTVWITDVVTASGADPGAAIAIIEPSAFVTSLLLVPARPQGPALSLSLSSLASMVPVNTATSSRPAPSTPLLPVPVTITDILTNTVTATLTAPPATVTVSAPLITVTDAVTISPLPPPTVPQTAWTAPAQMTDLAAFNVTNFACGQQNLHIVNGIPVDTGAVTLAAMADVVSGNNTSTPAPSWTNSSAVLQLFYPADSINPGTEPQGGADFYATPLALHDAKNVSLEYSVFFPVDFDWVQGGKLPGIYGGHMGCSGGDAAVTCFSTRLMWRAGGAGELYLYAPKDKQTDALCSTPPVSVCAAAYGLSIGRGSFNFTAGGWTHVRQTVSLNTPGAQDGGFVLEVNRQPVLNLSDVFYRDVPGQVDPGDDDGDDDGSDNDGDGDDGDDDSSDQSVVGIVNDVPSGQVADGDGLLGGLLGNLIIRIALWPASGVLMLRDDTGDPSTSSDPALLPSPTAFAERPVTDAAASAILAGFMSTANETSMQETSTITSTSISTSTTQAAPSIVTEITTPVVTSTATVYPSVAPTPDALWAIEEALDPQPVPFTGLFFSTFFGGHEPEYATPKDQYAWFRDFSMTINS